MHLKLGLVLLCLSAFGAGQSAHATEPTSMDQVRWLYESWFSDDHYSEFSPHELFVQTTQILHKDIQRCMIIDPSERKQYCTKLYLKRSIEFATTENLISSEESIVLMESVRSQKYEKHYQKHLAQIRKNIIQIEGKSPNSNDRKRNTLLHDRKRLEQTFGNLDELSPIDRLYFAYSPEQITKLSELMQQTLKLFDADDASIVFSWDDQSKRKIQLSPTESYRLALKILKRDLKRERISGILKGTDPLMIDLLTAAYVTGALTEHTLNTLIENPDFQDPKLKIVDVLFPILYGLGRAGLSANPITAPYAIPAFIILDTLNGINQLKDQKEASDDLF